MAKVKVTLNKTLLNREMKKRLPSAARGRIANIYHERFEVAKAIMIEEFEMHPVTLEIEQGYTDPAFGRNLSGRLGGVGNLYSYIGFSKNEGNPLDPIRSILNSATIGRSVVKGGKVVFGAKIPLKEQIFSVTPMPWANGRSWAEGIEKGISGFGFYLRTDEAENSRSGGGIQVQNKARSGRYKNGPYISKIINNFLNRMNIK